MVTAVRTLVIDDDELAARMVAARLHQRFPSMRVDVRTEPEPGGDYDVYLIDNDFHGQLLGADLARRIRAGHPDALVVAFSGTLDAPVLKELLNAGCHGACDKGNDQDFETLIELIRGVVESAPEERPSRGFLGVLRSMTELLREWNLRLDHLEAR